MLCTKCNQEKDINQFYKQKDRKKGFNSHCKTCKDEASILKWKLKREWAIEYSGSVMASPRGGARRVRYNTKCLLVAVSNALQV
jgi:hypothetical protein